MQKFLNNPQMLVDDMIKGYVKANNHICLSYRNNRVIKLKNRKSGVGIVSGGGSGHEPAFLGYVDEKTLHSVAIGEIFTSPSAKDFYDAFVEADNGLGIICIIGNYAGDKMNVNMAKKMAQKDGIDIRVITIGDDVASYPKENKEKRHGLAGGIFIWKLASYLSEKGYKIDDIVEKCSNYLDKIHSVCVGLSSCIIPDVGKSNFSIKEGYMEFGIGHHGEAGIEVLELMPSKKIAHKMIKYILDDINIYKGQEVAIILSGLGATPLIELYCLYNDIYDELKGHNIVIYKSCVGNYTTSLDMNGISLTIFELDDDIKDIVI